MNLVLAKKHLTAALCAVFVLSLGFAPLAYADTKPYFKARGADVAAGGWFYSGANCNTALFQDNFYNNSADNRYGGILTFINTGSNVGSSDQFAAFSLGLIQGGNNGNKYGFYSQQPQATYTNHGNLSFANSVSSPPTGFWGGLFQGSSHPQTVHCIPDYYSKKIGTPLSFPGFSAASAQYYNTGSPYTLAGGTVPAGKSITLFVKGSVYISGNITYASHTADNVPKFALVVLGSIYVNPAVSQLDGLYIAQPDPANANQVVNDTGVFWTCHSSDPNQVVKFDYVASTCNSSLTVNGAVIAKQVNLLRSNGDIGNATVAETFNYTPEMIIGGPFFNPPGGTAKIESLISLPPIF